MHRDTWLIWNAGSLFHVVIRSSFSQDRYPVKVVEKCPSVCHPVCTAGVSTGLATVRTSVKRETTQTVRQSFCIPGSVSFLQIVWTMTTTTTTTSAHSVHSLPPKHGHMLAPANGSHDDNAARKREPRQLSYTKTTSPLEKEAPPLTILAIVRHSVWFLRIGIFVVFLLFVSNGYSSQTHLPDI